MSGVGSCVAAVFYSGSSSCYIKSGTLGPSTFNPSLRTVRLINSTYPYVTDMQWPMPTPTASNLGLCTSASGYMGYAYQTILPQYVDGTYPSTGGTKYLYEQECGRYFSPGSATTLSVLTIMTLSGLGTPHSAEDCLRLCNYANHNTGNSGGTCYIYLWSVSASTCTLYNGVGTGFVTDADKYSGRYLTGAYAAITDQPGGFGYKRMARPTPAAPDPNAYPDIMDRPAGFGFKPRDTPVLTLRAPGKAAS